jgi:chitin synthase
MLEFAGLDLTNYFPVPFPLACPGLVTSYSLFMQRANFTPTVAYAIHTSGPLQTVNGTQLDKDDWYYSRLSPFIEQYYKGQFVYSTSAVQSGADQDSK